MAKGKKSHASKRGSEVEPHTVSGVEGKVEHSNDPAQLKIPYEGVGEKKADLVDEVKQLEGRRESLEVVASAKRAAVSARDRAMPEPDQVDLNAASDHEQSASDDGAEDRPLSPLRAIRLHCLDCSNGVPGEVRHCPIPECRLFPMRFGTNPNRSGIGSCGNLSCDEQGG